MKKLFVLFLILSALTIPLHAEEGVDVIAGFDTKTDLPVLNSEIRKLDDKNKNVDDRVTILEAAPAEVPTGVVVIWGAALASPPSGYLTCDGTAVSRTTYSALFAVIGTTWGAGDGSTTFNLPNLTNKFPYGASEGSAAGNASVGSSKLRDAQLSGNDSSVLLPFRTIQTFIGGVGGVSPNPTDQDLMAPYLSVAFIIKT